MISEMMFFVIILSSLSLSLIGVFIPLFSIMGLVIAIFTLIPPPEVARFYETSQPDPDYAIMTDPVYLNLSIAVLFLVICLFVISALRKLDKL